MKRLRKLDLFLRIDEVEQKDFESIGKLQWIKELGISFNELEAAPLVKSLAANNSPIERLAIHVAIIDDDAIKYISKLKQITQLEFCAVMAGMSNILLICLEIYPN